MLKGADVEVDIAEDGVGAVVAGGKVKPLAGLEKA